jgi:hypothetical protein
MTEQRPSIVTPDQGPDPDDDRMDVTEGEVGSASLKEPSVVAPPDFSGSLTPIEEDRADGGRARRI